MAKSQQTFNKSEKEKKRRKKKEDKEDKRQARKLEKEQNGPKSFEDMISYVDENGFFHDTPPDPTKKKILKVEDIVISVPSREHVPFDPIRHGTVKFFNNEKGYGFIIDSETKESVFVHVNGAYAAIKENDKVVFEIEMGQKGPNATRVKIDEEPEKKPTPKVAGTPTAISSEEE
jgi:cold shock CspA family protein